MNPSTVSDELPVPGLDPLLARTREIERLNQEMLLLYNASHQLNQASTPNAQLEAISDYARQTGAVRGTLFYLDESENDTRAGAVVVAEWGANSTQYAIGIGTRFNTVDLPFVQTLLQLPVQPVLIGDFTTQAGIDEESRAISDAYEQRATVILPVRNNGRWIALVWFSWQKVCHFTDYDHRIYTSLMQQASPVIDAMRLLEETTRRAQALEQANAEIDLLYRMSEAINRANTYEELLQAVMPLDPGTDVLVLQLWEHMDWHSADYMDVMAIVCRPPAETVLQVGMRQPRDAYPFAEQLYGERVLLFNDVLQDPRVDAMTGNTLISMNVHAFIALGVYIDHKWAGGLGFHSSQPRQYDESDARLLAGISDLATAAVRRIVYQQEMEQSRRQLEAIARMSATAASILDENELLRAIVQLIDSQFRDYHSMILLYDNEQRQLYHAVPVLSDDRIPLEDATSPAAGVARQRESLIINDIAAASGYVVTCLPDGVQSLMSLPMIAGDQLIGVLEIQSSMLNRFHDTDMRVMNILADMMAVAIQNARLYQRAQSYAVLEERNRIARELHDSVSQALYGMALGARTARAWLDRDPSRVAEPLDYVLTLAEAGLAEMRALIFELRPETLEKEGLIEALSKQVTMIRARHGLQVQTQFCPEPAISLRQKEATYWILREGLHNIVKHARATTACLTMQCLPDVMTVTLQDDGTGFDVAADYTGHLGLHSMRERAQKIDATLDIQSARGAGTCVTLMIPIHHRAESRAGNA